ncbi:hypothetical protein [Nocardioides sp. SR21]|uniref:hypothetical protein n=1 Tax=Nocardioides sp. SR21 TaxID=2919501 RepID=UPI001FAA6181|nr:hypothetical protein [Nocardioides sp. SR21]
MGTFGGRRALTLVCALAALCLPAGTLAGCSAALDLAHSVQTKLGRIDGVVGASVATPTRTTGAAIAVTFADADSERELAALVKEIDEVADDAEYPSYRLDLTPAGGSGDRLTVDDTFSASPDRDTVLGNWFSVTAALLGPVQYSFEPGAESISVDSGAGVGHDVGEASRIRYGFSNTTWTFTNGDTTFVVSGRVSPTDVTMFESVQRSVSSDVLPAPARSWRLERHEGHVLLDLDVTFAEGPVDPARLTVEEYGDDIDRLLIAAVPASRIAGLPVRLGLRNPPADVFGYWISDERPQRGRDPLVRGWDLWILTVVKNLI